MSNENLQEVVDRLGSKAAAARELDIPISTLKDRLRREGKKKVREVRVRTKKPMTVKQAMKKLNIDEADWDVQGVEYNTHPQAYALKLKLQRKTDDASRLVMDAATKAMRGIRAIRPQPAHTKRSGLLLEVALSDLHLGKRAWAEEVGDDFDVEIARKTYDNAIADTLERISPYRKDLERIVLVVGSDFFQTGFDGKTTLSGTVVDAVDTRFAQVFETGYRAVLKSIQTLSEIANVEAIYVPANHDPHVSWALSFMLAEYFRDNAAVKVDYSPKVRKYLEHGSNMLCLAHGHDVRLADLPSIVASEAREMWGRCQFREIHVGHFHRKKQVELLKLDESFGVILRILSALSGQDKWHVQQGFVGARRACESFIYDKTEGIISTFNVNARS